MQRRQHIALFALTMLLGAALGIAAPVNPYGLNTSGKLVPADNVNTSLLSGPISCTTAQGTGAGAAAPWSMELTDGSAFYTGAKTGQFPASLVGGRLDVNIGASSATVPVSAASLPLPSGAATAAKQPAPGTAGTPSVDVISVQGVVGGTAIPVNGTVTVQQSTASNLKAQVTGAGTAGTADTGVVTIQGIAGATAVKTDGSATTQPTSSASASQVDGHSANIGALADASSANTLTGLLKAIKAAVQGSLAVTPLATAATTASLSSVAMTTTGAQVWPATTTAKVRKIYNLAANSTLYCVYYDGVNNVTSEATAQFVVLPGQVWEMPNFPGVVEYTGVVRCALATGSGNINATQG